LLGPILIFILDLAFYWADPESFFYYLVRVYEVEQNFDILHMHIYAIIKVTLLVYLHTLISQILDAKGSSRLKMEQTSTPSLT
jgi:hypothetical protein